MSGDRNNTIRAQRPRRGGRTVCLAAGLSLAVLGLAFTSLPAGGEPAPAAPAPATQPADAQAQSAAQPIRGARAADPAHPGARVRDGRPNAGTAAAAPDPAEISWDEIAAFMRQHSPQKWERWEQFNRQYPGPGGRGDMKQRLEDGIRGQYAQLKKIESADAEEYKLNVRRVEIEDKIFGTVADFKHAVVVEDVSKQSMARTQMKQHVRDYLALRDELQKHRLERQLKALAKKPEPNDRRITNLADDLLAEQPLPIWDRAGSGPANPRSAPQRRDGAADGREQRPARAGPTTNRSADDESPKGGK